MYCGSVVRSAVITSFSEFLVRKKLFYLLYSPLIDQIKLTTQPTTRPIASECI